MTTIAYRDGVLAADSRVTFTGEAGGHYFQQCEKLFRLKSKVKEIPGQVVFGSVGDVDVAARLVEWIETGEKPEDIKDEEDDADAVILHRSGLWVANKQCALLKCKGEFYAFGSGVKAALAAMHCGKTAQEAIKIASKVDQYTDDCVSVMTLTPEAKPRRKRKPVA